MISERVRQMIPSMTVQLTDKLDSLKRQGVPIIKLNIGEPDFDTPRHIIEAGTKALYEGYTRYTVVAGLLELREAIGEKLRKDNGLNYSADEILVTAGAKQALMNGLMAICNEGDEVIVVTPCWVSYIEMIKLSGARPVLVPSNEKTFTLDLDGIKRAITDKTKAIMINTPNNPSGAVYSEKVLRGVGEIAINKNIYILSDEIYEKLIYDGNKHISIASLSEKIKERTLTINGFSKTYAMTGWRLGYAAGPRETINGMCTLQGHMTSGANAMAQRAAIEALSFSQDCVTAWVTQYDERRRYIIKRLQGIKDIRCSCPKGTFYLFPNVEKYFGKAYKGWNIRNSTDLSNYLLEEGYVAVVPGTAFHTPNHIRIAYCNSMENLIEGMDRMEKALKRLGDKS